MTTYANDGAILAVDELGPATQCQAAHTHEPRPMRHVWHHILPQVCGGQTQPENLAELCDSCHYAVHALMYALVAADGDEAKAWGRHGAAGQRALAAQGYRLAVATGTTAKIPDEGGVVLG
jgi:hypothetical protein